MGQRIAFLVRKYRTKCRLHTDSLRITLSGAAPHWLVYVSGVLAKGTVTESVDSLRVGRLQVCALTAFSTTKVRVRDNFSISSFVDLVESDDDLQLEQAITLSLIESTK